MRIVLAELKQESNTFSPFATTLEAFEAEGYVLRGEEISPRLAGTNTELSGALEVLDAAGMVTLPAYAAWSLSGGALTSDAHAMLRADLLGSLIAMEPFDAILLVLHGALVAQDCNDVEGALLEQLRARYGRGLPIVCSLDMHANFTRRMLDGMTACAVYQTNPHTDFADTGRRAARLLLRVLRGESLFQCVAKLPLLIPPENSADTAEPMRGLLARVRELEGMPGIAAAGVLPCQPWLDVEELGASTYVASDLDAAAAERAVLELAERLWSHRFELDTSLVEVDEAIRQALAEPGLTVFSDCADSTTSGSAGDSTYVLAALLGAKLERPAYVLVVDPVAAGQAAQKVGESIRLGLGGRLDPVHNETLMIEGEVLRAGEYEFQMKGQSFSGLTVRMGLSAVVQCESVSILLTSRRVLTVDPELYRAAGLEPAEAAIVLVKSPIMYRANYASIASRMLTINAPGASPSDLTRLKYSKLQRPCFPWDRGMTTGLEQRIMHGKDCLTHANS